MYPILRSLRRARPPPMPAVPTIRYPEGMRSAPHADDAGAWAGQTADVPAEWFAPSPGDVLRSSTRPPDRPPSDPQAARLSLSHVDAYVAVHERTCLLYTSPSPRD